METYKITLEVNMYVGAESKTDALMCVERMASEYLSTGCVSDSEEIYGVDMKSINYEIKLEKKL